MNTFDIAGGNDGGAIVQSSAWRLLTAFVNSRKANIIAEKTARPTLKKIEAKSASARPSSSGLKGVMAKEPGRDVIRNQSKTCRIQEVLL
jgi:hypothetical protein